MIDLPGIPQKQYARDAKCPLDGVRVLDLSRVVAGNMLSLLLADFGAEVVKVETPEGDALRDWLVGGVAANWKVYARNKKSVCLNLRKRGGQGRVAQAGGNRAGVHRKFPPRHAGKNGPGAQTCCTHSTPN